MHIRAHTRIDISLLKRVKYLVGILRIPKILFSFAAEFSTLKQKTGIMSLEIEGRVSHILPEQSGTSARGEWVRGGFAVRTEGEYPKSICFEVLGRERIDKIRPYLREGGLVKVSFDVSSREWQGRWFTSLTAFSVFAKESEIGQSQSQGQNVQQAQSPAPQPQPAPQSQKEEDPLPF